MVKIKDRANNLFKKWPMWFSIGIAVASYGTTWFLNEREFEYELLLLPAIVIMTGIMGVFFKTLENKFETKIDVWRNNSKLISEIDKYEDSKLLSKNLLLIAKSMNIKRNNFLDDVHKNKFESIASEYKKSISNVYSINFNHSSKLVLKSLKDLLDYLPNNSKYFTLSCLGFWNQATIREPDLFLEKNNSVANAKNIKIERLILLSKSKEKLSTLEIDILKKHKDTSKSNNISTKILKLGSQKKVDVQGNYAICELPDGRIITVTFTYLNTDDETSYFSSVTFRLVDKNDVVSLDSYNTKKDKFTMHFDNQRSKLIQEFLL